MTTKSTIGAGIVVLAIVTTGCASQLAPTSLEGTDLTMGLGRFSYTWSPGPDERVPRTLWDEPLPREVSLTFAAGEIIGGLPEPIESWEYQTTVHNKAVLRVNYRERTEEYSLYFVDGMPHPGGRVFYEARLRNGVILTAYGSFTINQP